MKNLNQFAVPWRNPDEFNKVYESIYIDDINKNRWAVETMTVWETRCWPSLPISVEATLLFLRCKIQDKLYESEKSLTDAQETEMMYSTAIVRFVNLLVEKDQNSVTKHSMSYLAAKRNIPAWIVDVRHSVSHGLNPTLPVLRMAYSLIMEYLEKTYWAPESIRIASLMKTYDDEHMVGLVHRYRAVRYQTVTDKYDPEKPNKSPLGRVMKKIDFILSKPETKKRFLKVLVHPDNFVTKEDVNALVGDDKVFLDQNVKPDITAPLALKMFWYPMVQVLHKHDLVPTFLEMLLLSQENRTIVIFQKVVDSVVIGVLDLIYPNDPSKKTSENIFVHKGANLNLFRLLYSCMRGCSMHAATVYSRLAHLLDMKNWAQEIGTLLNMKQGRIVQNAGKKREIDITFTADDLEEDMCEAPRKNKKQKVIKNHWSLAPLSMDFSNVPIGHVFNPVDVTKKEEIKQEAEITLKEDLENIYFKPTLESQPVEKLKISTFIFNEEPDLTFMVYRKKQ